MWIQQYNATENGHEAWLSLLAHYDGPGEKEKRIATAKGTLRTLYYRNEKGSMNFEKYSSKMFDALPSLKTMALFFNHLRRLTNYLKGLIKEHHK